MSHPLNELKRRLEDNSIPLAKRFRLAKNVVYTHYFPTTPKERVIGEWLEELTNSKTISNKDFRDVLSWLDNVDDFTVEYKCRLIKIVSKYVNYNIIQLDDIKHIIKFLENPKVRTQLILYIDDFISICTTLLQHLTQPETKNIQLVDRLLVNISQYYKDCKKKIEFIVKLLDGENLETIFAFLGTENENTILNLCQSVLFPMTKKSFFVSYLNNLIRKDDLNSLIEERGENLQSVIKIMDTIFCFPKGRTNTDEKFLKDFIYVFVNSYSSESQLIFALYIMLANCIDLKQNYINPATKLTPIALENNEKVKRSIFLQMFKVLLKNEIDVNIQLRDTVNDRSKETIKTFLLFLQDALLNNIKISKKVDKVTLNIIITALKLDPSLVEQVTYNVLPPIMVARKNSSTIEVYTEMMTILLNTTFKLGRGVQFVHIILPLLKNCLESNKNVQLSESNLDESMDVDKSFDKLKKICSGIDVIPLECVDVYGRLTSELMFRQNKDLLVLFQEDLEEYCLKPLRDGVVNVPVIVITEILSAILSSLLRHNKMADHSVPIQIGEDFWSIYQRFESESLKSFGDCLLQLDYNTTLVSSFLKICISFAELKLLNFKYSNTKLDIAEVDDMDVYDMSLILPSLKKTLFAEMASKINDDETVVLMDNLLAIKALALEVIAKTETEYSTTVKSHLIKKLSPTHITKSYYSNVLLSNLDKSQLRQVAKSLVKTFSDTDNVVLSDFVGNNKVLLQALFLEGTKNVIKNFENVGSLPKILNKDFDISEFLKENSSMEYFNNLSLELENNGIVTSYLDIIKHLQIYYMDENSQLTAIFVLLALKKCCNIKKIKRTIDYNLQSIYEVGTKLPDLFKLFSVEDIFGMDNNFLDLLKLGVKTSNNLIILRSLLETAVKKVKIDSEIIKKIVEILLSKLPSESEKSGIEYFADPKFQIICMLLPIITKEKRNITTSAYRSILANLQEKLNQIMLNSFKNMDFQKLPINMEDGSDDIMTTLNAMNAYSLTLLKCCETNDGSEAKSMDCLWSGLEFFINNAIQIIEQDGSKITHVETSLQLINIVLRYKKKLESHEIIKDADRLNSLMLQIWRAVKKRLSMVHGHRLKTNNGALDEIAVTLKYLAELSSVQFFVCNIVEDLNAMFILKILDQLGSFIIMGCLEEIAKSDKTAHCVLTLKYNKPSIILKNDDSMKCELISREVSKFIWLNILKSNIIEAKCEALTKLMYRSVKNIKFWIEQHFSVHDNQNGRGNQDGGKTQDGGVKDVLKIDDSICEILKIDLKILAEVILAAKKISLDYKFIDVIFELQHVIHYVLGRDAIYKCDVTWKSFFSLFESSVAILNSMILSREELLEDRWPCYMQCYKTLVLCMCERSKLQNDDKIIEHKFAEISHSIEKLTQSVTKRKSHMSRIAAYAVADLCVYLESCHPPKIIRQHLENSVILLIQACDSSYAMAFLRRGLAGAVGQMTFTNIYTMYKRYHKYVGNA